MEAINLFDDKTCRPNALLDVAIRLATTGTTRPERLPAILATPLRRCSGSRNMLEKNKSSTRTQARKELTQRRIEIRDTAKDKRRDRAIESLLSATELLRPQFAAGWHRNLRSQNGVGLKARPGDARRQILQIDTIARANLNNLTGKLPEQHALAIRNQRLMILAGEAHQPGKKALPHPTSARR